MTRIRKISREWDVVGASSNPFWMRFGTQLEQCFQISPAHGRRMIDDIYVTKRTGDVDEEELANLRESMAEHLVDVAHHLGYVELSFLDFLLNVRDYRVLCLVGLRGVGKSTLVQYICLKLSRRIKALHQLLPVHIDLLGWRTDRQDHGDPRASSTLVDLALIGLQHACNEQDLAPRWIERLGWCAEPRDRAAMPSLSQLFDRIKQSCPDSEPLFIFDNTDQLRPDDLTTILEEARVLWVNHRATTIVAMRPNTYRTQIERGSNKAVFVMWALRVPPPDLRAALLRRVEWQRAVRNAPLSGVVTVGRDRVPVDDAEAVLTEVVSRVLDKEFQALILEGYANNDVRGAMLLVQRIVRCRDLSFLPQSNRAERRLLVPSDTRHTPLEALLLGPNRVFSEEATPPSLLNLYCCTTAEGPASYTVQFQMLSLLAWVSGYASWRNLQRWMMQLGHSRNTVVRIRDRLLQASLIYSPEVELEADTRFFHPDNLRITEAGRTHHDKLIRDPDYVFEVVYDVDLPHGKWIGVAKGGLRYPTRIWSMLELLEAVLAEETVQVAHALAHSTGTGEPIAALRSSRLLTETVWGALAAKLETGLRGEGTEARQAAQRVKDTILERGLEDRKAALVRSLGGAIAYRSIDEAWLRFDRALPLGGRLVVQFPRQVIPGACDEIRVSLTQNGGRRSRHLIAVLGVTGARATHEVLPLHWHGRDAQATTRLTNEQPTGIEHVLVQLFDGADPIGTFALQQES